MEILAVGLLGLIGYRYTSKNRSGTEYDNIYGDRPLARYQEYEAALYKDANEKAKHPEVTNVHPSRVNEGVYHSNIYAMDNVASVDMATIDFPMEPSFKKEYDNPNGMRSRRKLEMFTTGLNPYNDKSELPEMTDFSEFDPSTPWPKATRDMTDMQRYNGQLSERLDNAIPFENMTNTLPFLQKEMKRQRPKMRKDLRAMNNMPLEDGQGRYGNADPQVKNGRDVSGGVRSRNRTLAPPNDIWAVPDFQTDFRPNDSNVFTRPKDRSLDPNNMRANRIDDTPMGLPSFGDVMPRQRDFIGEQGHIAVEGDRLLQTDRRVDNGNLRTPWKLQIPENIGHAAAPIPYNTPLGGTIPHQVKARQELPGVFGMNPTQTYGGDMRVGQQRESRPNIVETSGRAIGGDRTLSGLPLMGTALESRQPLQVRDAFLPTFPQNSAGMAQNIDQFGF